MKKAAVLIALLAALASNAQELTKAPANPAFLKYQQAHIQKKVAANTASGHALGYRPSPVDFSYLRGRTSARAPALKALPSSYDLRDYAKLTPIRNQSPYGTCWAFATYSSLESTLMPGENRFFSVNNLANNSGFDYDSHDGGGSMAMSTAYLARWSGPIDEVDDPYTNGPGHSPLNLTVQKHVQEVTYVPLKGSALDNATIKQAVVNYGAMYIGMYIDDTDPYYNDGTSAYYYDGSESANHAVAIVGWDDSYSVTNFLRAPPGNGAFIVRNSWGPAWGENGYFYCSYYDTVMGYDENASFNNAEPVAKYNAIYQYDPLGRVTDYGYTSVNAWGANIFMATNMASLRAVGFYTTDVDVNYTIYIFGNVTAGNPTSGTLVLSQAGTAAYPGYHTVELSMAATLSAGNLFSIVIEFGNSTYQYPVAVEYALDGYSSRATAAPGESYLSSDGLIWTDLTDEDATANVCIKAFCTVGGGVPDAVAAGDMDGDRKADLISVVGSSWYVWYSGTQYLTRMGPYNFGVVGAPVMGDLDGDGLADLMMVVGTQWYVWFSTAQYQVQSGPFDLGIAGMPTTGDIDGDGLADLMMVVGTQWYVWFSTAQYQVQSGPFDLGIAGMPTTGDIDGDGLADLIDVIGSGWYVWFSTSSYSQRIGPCPLTL